MTDVAWSCQLEVLRRRDLPVRVRCRRRDSGDPHGDHDLRPRRQRRHVRHTLSRSVPSGPASSVPGQGDGVAHALVAVAGGVIDEHVYSRRHAPRVLSGRVDVEGAGQLDLDPAAPYLIGAVAGPMTALWSSSMKRAVGAGASSRSARSAQSFSYLLPSSCRPGRYVFEIQASDAAGDHTALHSGSSGSHSVSSRRSDGVVRSKGERPPLRRSLGMVGLPRPGARRLRPRPGRTPSAPRLTVTQDFGAAADRGAGPSASAWSGDRHEPA